MSEISEQNYDKPSIRSKVQDIYFLYFLVPMWHDEKFYPRALTVQEKVIPHANAVKDSWWKLKAKLKRESQPRTSTPIFVTENVARELKLKRRKR